MKRAQQSTPEELQWVETVARPLWKAHQDSGKGIGSLISQHNLREEFNKKFGRTKSTTAMGNWLYRHLERDTYLESQRKYVEAHPRRSVWSKKHKKTRKYTKRANQWTKKEPVKETPTNTSQILMVRFESEEQLKNWLTFVKLPIGTQIFAASPLEINYS